MVENTISNASNLTGQDAEMPLDIIFYGSIFYTFIFSIGVCGNLLVIYVLFMNRELRNFTNYLLANLSIADLLVLFTNVPSGLHDLFAKERWYLGQIWCYLVSFIENTTGFASILSIFFIACDRYYVICRPLNVKSVMNGSRTSKLIVFIWLISILVNLPYILLTSYDLTVFRNREIYFECTTRAEDLLSLSFIIADSFIFYVLIGIVLFIMFFKISKCLKVSNRFLKKNASLIYERVSICNKQSSISSYKSRDQLKSDSNTARQMKKRSQLIRMLMIMLASFYICIFPLKIWTLLNIFGSKIPGFYEGIGLRLFWFVNVTCRIFYYLNSSINPILYNFLSKKFCYSFKKLFIFRICFVRGVEANSKIKASYLSFKRSNEVVKFKKTLSNNYSFD
ncbi:unnamed protein product [Brachionus calyciflorus]|uniref:G-protein coupled receptors family 1 profile domain-containing protein n=1 Tax=Brachionus calyciflorus TaxID=104777 RepID=A0A813ST26_9BILA|nr:unnamed protein product [Brachionus calyciflorus]